MVTIAEVRVQASEEDCMEALPDFSQIETVQPDEDEPGTYDMGYTRFVRYYNRATGEVAHDLTRLGISVEEDSDVVALACYLIDDYDIRREPGWSNSSESRGAGLSFSRSSWNGKFVTEARRSYETLMDELVIAGGGGLAGVGTSAADVLLTHALESDYVDAMEKEATEESGYDTAEYLDGNE